MKKRISTVLTLLAGSLLVFPVHAQEAAEKRYAPAPDYAEDVYFGDTHIHSTLSADASLWGSMMGPADIYAYSRGEEVISARAGRSQSRPRYGAVVCYNL